MAIIRYIEKTITVSAGQAKKETIFKRTSEKSVNLHYLNIKTDANTSSAVIIIDSYVFSPVIGANASDELGPSKLFNKVNINDEIAVNAVASTAASATVFVFGYVEIES
jgi:hypothetical protein